MTCNLCGFNRRFERCIHDLLNKPDTVYKTNSSDLNCSNSSIVIHGKNSVDDQYTIENLYEGNDNPLYKGGSRYVTMGELKSRESQVEWHPQCNDKLLACDNVGLMVVSENLYTKENAHNPNEDLILKRKYNLLLSVIKKQQKQLKDTQLEICTLKNHLMIVEGKLQTAIDMNNEFNEIIHNQ